MTIIHSHRTWCQSARHRPWHDGATPCALIRIALAGSDELETASLVSGAVADAGSHIILDSFMGCDLSEQDGPGVKLSIEALSATSRSVRRPRRFSVRWPLMRFEVCSVAWTQKHNEES